MRKRLCALLIVLGAFGTVVGTTAPADAQTPPAQVAFWTRNRSVSFSSSFANCTNWTYNPASRVLVSRGSSQVVHDSWYVCEQNGKEIVADLYVHGTYGSDGWTLGQYELRVRVNWGGGTVWCGSTWAVPHGTWVNEGFTMFWYQGRLESGWHNVNCQHQGTVSVAFSVERGLGTW